MYDQLLHAGLPEFPATYQMLPPCIMKPKRLWSGKQVLSVVHQLHGHVWVGLCKGAVAPSCLQVLSTVLLNIIPDDQYDVNLTSTAKVLSKVHSNFTLNEYQKLYCMKY